MHFLPEAVRAHWYFSSTSSSIQSDPKNDCTMRPKHAAVLASHLSLFKSRLNSVNNFYMCQDDIWTIVGSSSNWGIQNLSGFTPISPHFHQARDSSYFAPSVFTAGESIEYAPKSLYRGCVGIREYTAKEKAPKYSLTFTAEEDIAQLTLMLL